MQQNPFRVIEKDRKKSPSDSDFSTTRVPHFGAHHNSKILVRQSKICSHSTARENRLKVGLSQHAGDLGAIVALVSRPVRPSPSRMIFVV